MATRDDKDHKWNPREAWQVRSTLFAILALALVVAGCGSAARQSSSGHDSPASTQAVETQAVRPVARVGVAARVAGHPITIAAFEHLLSAEVASEPSATRLVPPEYTACISHRRVLTGVSVSSNSIAELKTECEKEYQGVRSQVLGRLISAVWVVGEARELGVDAQRGAIEALVHKSQFKYAAAHEYLDAEAIRGVIRKRVGPISSARIAEYYKAHASQYVTPEQRDLRIVRVKTEAGAAAIKRELATGTTFASAARALVAHYPRLQQPYTSKEGLVRGLKPGVFNEKPLNDAIFRAKAHRLVGPVQVTFAFPGWFVFEVTKIVPARPKPRAQVEAALRRELPQRLYQEQLVSFVKAWRAKWRARTNCRPGFVVQKCRQFSVGVPGAHEDPYALA